MTDFRGFLADGRERAAGVVKATIYFVLPEGGPKEWKIRLIWRLTVNNKINLWPSYSELFAKFLGRHILYSPDVCQEFFAEKLLRDNLAKCLFKTHISRGKSNRRRDRTEQGLFSIVAPLLHHSIVNSPPQ